MELFIFLEKCAEAWAAPASILYFSELSYLS